MSDFFLVQLLCLLAWKVGVFLFIVMDNIEILRQGKKKPETVPQAVIML